MITTKLKTDLIYESNIKHPIKNLQIARKIEGTRGEWHGAKTQDGLKNVQEITVAKIAVQNLAKYCVGKQKEFRI